MYCQLLALTDSMILMSIDCQPVRFSKLRLTKVAKLLPR